MDKASVKERLKVFNGIAFDEQAHKYSERTEEGEYEYILSGTQRVHQFTNEFKGEEIARKVAEKRNEKGETTPEGKEWTMRDVLEEWGEIGKISTDIYGTPTHRYMELYNTFVMMLEKEEAHNKAKQITNNEFGKVNEVVGRELRFNREYNDKMIIEIIEPLIEECRRFVNKMLNKGYEPIASEQVVGDLDIGVAGTIDQLYWNKERECVEIWDWKTSKEIKMRGFTSMSKPIADKMRGVFRFYDDCNYNHYSLQLSLYKWILRNRAGIDVEGLYVGHISSKNVKMKTIKMRDMTEEIEEYFMQLDELF